MADEDRRCETCSAFRLADMPLVSAVSFCWLWNHAIPVGVDFCSWWRQATDAADAEVDMIRVQRALADAIQEDEERMRRAMGSQEGKHEPT